MPFDTDHIRKNLLGDTESYFSRIEKLKEVVQSQSNYSFEELQNLVKLSDLNNTNTIQRDQAEKELQIIGFYNQDGEIHSENFVEGFLTSDNKTLQDLEEWFETVMC